MLRTRVTARAGLTFTGMIRATATATSMVLASCILDLVVEGALLIALVGEVGCGVRASLH